MVRIVADGTIGGVAAAVGLAAVNKSKAAAMYPGDALAGR
jgi:hypothetical protein